MQEQHSHVSFLFVYLYEEMDYVVRSAKVVDEKLHMLTLRMILTSFCLGKIFRNQFLV